MFKNFFKPKEVKVERLPTDNSDLRLLIVDLKMKNLEDELRAYMSTNMGLTGKSLDLYLDKILKICRKNMF